MTRDEFMELVYETFADEPDNVLANGIIEAADAYVEHEKAQLFKEGTTSDLISRRQALKALRKCQTYLYDARDPELKIDLSSAEAAINNLPPIQPEPQWIPVERELPEDYVDVLVWFEYFRYGNYNRMCATHGIGNYSKEYNSWTINHETGWKDLHVFAWMPLPIPYQKGAIK